MKKIICYGDSNTFGFKPENGERFSEQERWTGILKNELSGKCDLIEEGLNNRTGFVKNPDGFDYSAPRHFPKLLQKYDNIFILILAIGTNDLQFQYNLSFKNIENGLENLISIAKNKAENIILIPPVVLNENIFNGFFKNLFDETSITKSKKVDKSYKKLAKKYHCDYFDINKFTQPSSIDGLHYDKSSHDLIAEKIKNFIEKNYLHDLFI